MAREIKFRGKFVYPSTQTGKLIWVYGDLIQYPKHIGKHLIETNGIRNEVLASTVGQFTGVRDVNGNEIYEGDILRIHMHDRYANEPEYQEGVIVFDDGRFFAKLPHDAQYLSVVNYEDYEVVGNEFDD